MSGLVISPEYSWLGASLDGVVHMIQVVLTLMDDLKSSALTITMTAPFSSSLPERVLLSVGKGKL